ncbi:ribose-5-phosphate isomerase RpiA [Ancylobacter amanitiformis]|uniref:Ribose-5-phosphate isomerase A n=1 Tax=Ancylobacter amanitiformis TaxID=217069 RepID=A0ABU0LMM6_9HYPH|nr:ribose-5-phosphate isomerase RpiA [Ancylobacter amanitiformis]MDQ0509959.1 ribose 5-phosphate isomerase A [Ancylobacter amanitiformis]
MSSSAVTAETLKRQAAARALEHVRSGMKLGLGTGSTAKHFVELLAERVAQGLEVVGVPTSEATRAQAESLGVPLGTLDEHPMLDLCVDGADEIGPDLTLVKGGGGALLREKIVASAAHEMIVIADASKMVAQLGAFSLPIEVVDFGVAAIRRGIERSARAAGCQGLLTLRRRADGHVFVTDQGHLILDAAYGVIREPALLAARLAEVPGVVEHGLFINLASRVILAGADGVTVIDRA